MSESQAAATTPMKSILAAIAAVITTVVLALTGGDKKEGEGTNTAKEPPSKSQPAQPAEDSPKAKDSPRAKDSTKPAPAAQPKKHPAKRNSKSSNSKSSNSKSSNPKSSTGTTKRTTTPKRSRFDRSTSPGRNNRSAGLEMAADGGAARIESLFKARRSDAIVTGRGRIHRVLRDDLEGSRHQKWILKLSNNRTILFAHNIDLAPRVPLERGDEIEFRGEYEFNDRGGVVHWTHHDPRGRHEDGFIRHRGKTYK